MVCTFPPDVLATARISAVLLDQPTLIFHQLPFAFRVLPEHLFQRDRLGFARSLTVKLERLTLILIPKRNASIACCSEFMCHQVQVVHVALTIVRPGPRIRI
jgi:hypothetical protein